LQLWQNAFEKSLKQTLGDNLRITWTNNRRVMISYKVRKGVPLLRLHESFATADDGLKSDLVHYLTKGRRVPPSIKDFIRDACSAQDRPPRSEKRRTKGQVYDLSGIYRKLNREYFSGSLSCRISWGRKIFCDRKRSLTFGSYMPDGNLIRIHPVLDTEMVPSFFIEAVVYHEMVHAYLHSTEKSESHIALSHGPRFKELESRFRLHGLAKAWERRHFTKLLRFDPCMKSPS